MINPGPRRWNNDLDRNCYAVITVRTPGATAGEYTETESWRAQYQLPSSAEESVATESRRHRASPPIDSDFTGLKLRLKTGLGYTASNEART